MGILDFFKNKYKKSGFTKQQEEIQDKYACYFNDNGKCLNKKEIKEINNNLLNYAVLKDEIDVEFMKEYFMVAHLTKSHKKIDIIEARNELKERVDSGAVIGRCESAILAKNVIFKRPGDVYVIRVNDNPDDLKVEGKHYLDLSETERQKVLSEVQKYDKVRKSKIDFRTM